MNKLFFGFALADSMFAGDVTITRKELDVATAKAILANASVEGKNLELVPCLNPSHQATIDAMRIRYGIEVDIPATAPQVQLATGDYLVVMGVRGLPRLDATRHEYTQAEIEQATFKFSLYSVA